jgi:hypothetical protein
MSYLLKNAFTTTSSTSSTTTAWRDKVASTLIAAASVAEFWVAAPIASTIVYVASKPLFKNPLLEVLALGCP